MNLVHREGEARIDDDRRRTTLASLGLDYRGDALRGSLDFGYQKKTFHNSSMGVRLDSPNVTKTPRLPSRNSQNYTQKWTWNDIENQFGMARAEYDITSDWAVYGALGGQHAHEKGDYSSPGLMDNDGKVNISRMINNYYIDTFSGMGGIRGAFDTGFVSHKVNIGYAAMTKRVRNAWAMTKAADRPTMNLYEPQQIAPPTLNYFGGPSFSDPLTTARSRTKSVLLSDTLGVLDDTLLFTVGARYQEVVARNYSPDTGIQKYTQSQNKSRWLPTYGVVYKPSDEVSLYANHTQALQPQASSITGGAKYDSRMNIAHSTQYEAGVKVDFGNVGGTMSVFEIKNRMCIAISPLMASSVTVALN